MKHQNGTTRSEENVPSEEGVQTVLCEMKVPNGKLVICELVVKKRGDSSPELVRVGFYGDFFLHPEEKIEDIEREVSRGSLDDLPKRTRAAFKAEDMELVGVGVEDFVKVVEEALKKCC